MSNFGLTYLFGQTLKSGLYLTIEDNIGEPMHLHIDKARIDIDINEFNDVVKKAPQLLSDLLELPIEQVMLVDPVMLFEMSNNNVIRSLYAVKSSSIFTKDIIFRKNIILNSYSGSYNSLKKNIYSEQSKEYARNYYQCNVTKRLFDYRARTPNKDEIKIYLLGDTNISLSDPQVINYLADKEEVNVIRLYFRNNLLLSRKRLFHSFLRHCFHRLKFCYRKSHDVKEYYVNNIDSFDLQKSTSILSFYGIKFAIIPGEANDYGKDIIVTEDIEKIEKIPDFINCSHFRYSINKDRNYIYGLQRPLCYVERDKVLFVNFNAPYSYGLGESIVMPYSKKIIKGMYSTVSDKGVLNEKYYILFLLGNCLLVKRSFSDNDIVIINRYLYLFDDKEFNDLLCETFYKAAFLINDKVKKQEFDSIFDSYRRSYFNW